MQAEYRTVSTPVTLIVPAQVDTTTPLTLFSTAEEVYASIAGNAIACEIVHLLLEATRDSGAVVVLYRHDHETTARVLWPVAVFVSQEHALVCRAYCTDRQQYRNFRLDRMAGAPWAACHPLTTPDDDEAARA